MTRKDYQLISGAFRRTLQVVEYTEHNQVRKLAKTSVIRLAAHDITATLEHENARFDRNKFLEACGVTE